MNEPLGLICPLYCIPLQKHCKTAELKRTYKHCVTLSVSVDKVISFAYGVFTTTMFWTLRLRSGGRLRFFSNERNEQFKMGSVPFM